MKSKSPPLFSIFSTVRTNSRDLHCALSEEEEGGIMSNSLYRGTIVTDIVMSARLSLLMHSSDEHDDFTNARRYCSLRQVATTF
jgi:hypothetical protein